MSEKYVINASVTNSEIGVEKRTITGIAAITGVPANASTGRVQFEAGSLHLPEELKRVKLCVDHDHTRAVGYATKAVWEDNQLIMSFYLPESEAGDQALAKAANGILDGLSVGAYPQPGGYQFQHDTETMHVTNAVVREVSLTSLPAFDDARVKDVKASTKQEEKEKNTMDTTKIKASAEKTDKQEVAPTPPQAPPITPNASAPRTIKAAAELAVKLQADGAPAATIRAALSDIVPADDKGTGFIGRESWIGELWQARRVDRPLIDQFAHRAITGTKVKGWRWVTRPQVGEYAGNKTEIASNKVKTESVESEVKRIAGGWDIDRIYVDLGDADFIAALWAAALEDYLLKSEEKFTKELLDGATKVTGTAQLPNALATLGVEAAKKAAKISFVAFSPDVWAKFVDLKREEVPWWLTGSDTVNLATAQGTVNNLKLFTNPSLGTGTILAGDSRAATFYETNPPIRVNAVDLAHGGIDLGLFGYTASIINDSRSLYKMTVAGA